MAGADLITLAGFGGLGHMASETGESDGDGSDCPYSLGQYGSNGKTAGC